MKIMFLFYYSSNLLSSTIQKLSLYIHALNFTKVKISSNPKNSTQVTFDDCLHYWFISESKCSFLPLLFIWGVLTHCNMLLFENVPFNKGRVIFYLFMGCLLIIIGN